MPKLNKRKIVGIKSFQVLIQTDQTISKSISAMYNLLLTVYDKFLNLTTQMLQGKWDECPLWLSAVSYMIHLRHVAAL